MFVLIPIYVCPHTTICALILLYLCPHTTLCVSSCRCSASWDPPSLNGTQFTCFTSTIVQILTPGFRSDASTVMTIAHRLDSVLNLLALLVPKYKYWRRMGCFWHLYRSSTQTAFLWWMTGASQVLLSLLALLVLKYKYWRRGRVRGTPSPPTASLRACG